MADLTPSQTIGPFFADGLRWAMAATTRAAQPDEVTVSGKVLDADGKAVTDALIEVWQPGKSGELLAGLQRVPTDDAGAFRFHVSRTRTHARVTVFARGLLKAVSTRLYLDGNRVPTEVPVSRAGTLTAQPTAAPSQFAWNIVLGGPAETVFFDT